MPKFDWDINFLFEIGTLRRVARTWNEFFWNDVANVADHTLRVVWIAMIIAKHEKVDNIGHILKLALVHDISEIRCVDVHYISRQYVVRHEDKAINDTFENTVIWNEFIKLWKEVEEKSTIEAKIVKDADNLDVDMEIVEKIYEGFKIWDMWKENRLKVVNTKLFTKTAKEMQKEIYDSNPHNWHIQNKNNRFNLWDWKKEK